MKLNALHVFILCLVLLCIVVINSQNYKEGLRADGCETEKGWLDNSDNSDEDQANYQIKYDECLAAQVQTTVADGNEDTFDTLGVASSQIPSGDDDLYILKSEIVPPVCPACPTSSACPREKPCQPCPPCARCPEPSFECKKVPNYDSHSAELPKPVLNDFSQFGN
jgi:hypothetical protein